MFYYLTSNGHRVGDNVVCKGAQQPVQSQLRDGWPLTGHLCNVCICFWSFGG